jgi:hypothetical protein
MPTSVTEQALPPPTAGAELMLQQVRDMLCFYEVLWGGKFAHKVAEELLLAAVIAIEHTAGTGHTRKTLREVGKALASEEAR